MGLCAEGALSREQAPSKEELSLWGAREQVCLSKDLPEDELEMDGPGL